MKYSVAMTDPVAARLAGHLARADGQEDLCFAIWRPSRGSTRTTALLVEPILPLDGDRNVHGNASFNPQYVERTLERALDSGGGIAFLHSHPAHGWQGMSADDVRAEKRLAPTVQGATGLPLLGLTLAARDGAWSARVWEKVAPKRFSRQWAQSVRVLGDRLQITFADQVLNPPGHRLSQARTISAWGEQAHAQLARLRVGVVGVGSVGSLVAEMLARTGIQRIQLLDDQLLEEVNLDRTLHASRADVVVRRSKVDVSARAIRRSATAAGFRVEPTRGSVCTRGGLERVLDCDVIFSCVDRPWPRSVLNFVAYAHLIPIIDGGILVSRTPTGQLRGADWKAHLVGPAHRCLLCLGQYDPGLVDADRRGDLSDPSYLESLPADHPARRNENVFGFSANLASLEFLQFLMYAIGPLGLGASGPQNYHLMTGTIDLGGAECEAGCVFPQLIATGDQYPSGV